MVLSIRKLQHRLLAPCLEGLLDWCYPGVCAACGALCEGRLLLCGRCERELEALNRPACPRCAMPLAGGGDPCPYCQGKGVYPFDRIIRLGLYREPLKGLIHQMKYEGRWPLAEYLGDRLVELPAVRQLLDEADCLLPVPLHWRRQFSRGYNQSEVLARRLGNGHRLRLVRPAMRIRDTETQTQLTSAALKRRNIRGAFALVRPKSIAGKRVVLIDDVTTSGATLGELARTLLPAKPAGLSAIVLAIADPRGRGFEAI